MQRWLVSTLERLRQSRPCVSEVQPRLFLGIAPCTCGLHAAKLGSLPASADVIAKTAHGLTASV